MKQRRLQNYLRTHRRRSGLSQREMARLLGGASGAKVCRYEAFARLPSMLNALSCEIILGQPVCEIFAGVYERLRRDVRERARRMLKSFAGRESEARMSRKLAALRRIIEAEA